MPDWSVILCGYLLGSVPFAFLLARGRGVDIRVSGSRNVGAANGLRVTGGGRGGGRAVFRGVVGAPGYVSLGWVGATVVLPPMAWLTGASAAVVTGASAAALLIVFRHRSNLARIP